MRYLLLTVSFLFLLVPCHAVVLREDCPMRYEVQPGDTLWSIASRYLQYPWEWKALWSANPKIKNPNRLFPGAVLALAYHRKNPYLKVLSNGTVKLSPYVHTQPYEEPIPAIPLMDIKPFFNASLVLDKDSLSHAPFVVAFSGERMLGGQGDALYVKNLCPGCTPPGTTVPYAIYRPCGKYTDPATRKCLGFKATLVGYAELSRTGDPATVIVTDIVEGVRLGDKVLPNDHPDFDLYFEPRAPSRPICAVILDLVGDYTQGAVGEVVVINRGKDAGLQAGDVLGVFTQGNSMSNAHCPPNCVNLPPERLGEIMVFRTFTQTSYALVVRSIRAIKRFDKVTNP